MGRGSGNGATGMNQDFFDRFFGRGVARPGGDPVANPRVESPLSLQILFDAPLDLDGDGLALALRSFHPELAEARAEVADVSKAPPPEGRGPDEPPPAVLGLLGWGRQVVKLVGFSAPMPREPVEACVRPAHIPGEMKEAAYAHAAHVLLYYAGYEADPHEQYVGLAAAAAALARFGATTVLNESARTAVPAVALLPHDDDPGDGMQMLRTLPIPLLYGGFVKLEVEGQDGVWMRTFGNHLLRMPDLAYRAEGHHQGAMLFEVFGHMLDYLRESGRTFAAGDTMQVGRDFYLRLRERTEAEWFLESDGELLVADAIAAGEANG